MGYDFTIEYKAGRENQGADALSRAFLTLTTITSSWIPLLQQELQQLQPISEFSQDELLSGRLTIKKGLWFWDDRVFIPASSVLKTMLLKEYHDSVIGSHEGCQKTLSWLSAQFF